MVSKRLSDYYMADSMFQPFNYVVVKTGNFLLQSCGKKAIKTFMLPKTTIQEVPKHNIQEIGQRSNECRH